MRKLHIDIETYSEVDLTETGVYPYSRDESFEILLFGYAYDDEEPQVLDLTDDAFPGESIPAQVIQDLWNPDVLKIAQNANFEIECLGAFFGRSMKVQQWECTMVRALYLGLPANLDKIAQALGLDQQKDTAGKALIKYFSVPCKPTKVNGGRTRNRPEHDREKWQQFIDYCAQDVRTEQAIDAYCNRQTARPSTYEHSLWHLDQVINSRGVHLDTELIEAARKANTEAMEEIHAELVAITGLENPNSPKQIKEWLEDQAGEPFATLKKEWLEEVLETRPYSAKVMRALELRQMGSRTSISKFEAMVKYLNKDGRIRGLFQFYGANRTGRFAGRGVQVQNLKRSGRDLEIARDAVKAGVAGLIYEDVPEKLSELIRPALVAKPGCLFAVSDFAAIEARVLAWLAGEEWVLDVFKSHGKIYEATASGMFGVPIEQITKDSDYRKKGKVASLALGYQGASGALIAMGALREGLTEQELPGIVSAWRAANPKIVKFWRKCENAMIHAIRNKTTVTLNLPYCKIVFTMAQGRLTITLPSGRELCYHGAFVQDNKIKFYGMNQTTKQWQVQDTYGGSIVENITQAFARDCLCWAMYRIHFKGVAIIVMHIHDEIVAEAAEDEAKETLEAMEEIMSEEIPWAKGLPLKGDGYISPYYKKD